MTVSTTGNIAVHNIQGGLGLYHYSPEKGITRRKSELSVSSGSDVAIAACANDDTVVLVDWEGVVRVCALSSGEEICNVRTEARECIPCGLAEHKLSSIAYRSSLCRCAYILRMRET